MSKITAVRGMHDILPSNIGKWHYFEAIAKRLLSQYGYQEIRLPMIEKTELFYRSVGQSTDIVEKETYDFKDRNNETLTLRPEGTASCVRAMIEHGLLRNQLQKLWYLGPMFRYERPQKGRYRQFYQLGVEVYGSDCIAQDAELLTLTWRLWQKLKLSQCLTLEINNLGSQQDRLHYKEALVAYLRPLQSQLDPDSQRRLNTNPLRILDSKNQQTKAILKNAPRLSEFITEASQTQFKRLLAYLTAVNIPVKVNHHLVRGLDYYADTVFEWVSDQLGAQGSICAGGRYNHLVAELGGQETPAVGFAIGIERIILLLETLDLFPNTDVVPDVYVISDQASILQTMPIIERLRLSHPGLKIEQNTTLGSLKSQFKKADKSGAKFAIVIAENEMANDNCIVKFLREDKAQITLPQQKLGDFFQSK